MQELAFFAYSSAVAIAVSLVGLMLTELDLLAITGKSRRESSKQPVLPSNRTDEPYRSTGRPCGNER